MTERTVLQDALVRAHEAGDFEAARLFAEEIKGIGNNFGETQGGAVTGLARRRRPVAPVEDARPKNDPTRVSSSLKIGPVDTGVPLSEGATNFLAGIGREFSQTGQGVSQILGFGPNEAEVDAGKALDAPLLRNPAGAGGGVIGSLAQVAPTMFIPGVNTVAGSGLMGSVLGAMRPVGSDDSRITNMAIGGGIGAAVPAILNYGPKSATAIRNALIDRFGELGQQRSAVSAIERAAGGPSEMAKVLSRVDAANQPAVGPFADGLERKTMGELVPGSIPSLAEIAKSPGIAALQRTAGQTIPSVMREAQARETSNDAARSGLLNFLSGDRLTLDEAASLGVLSRKGGGLMNAEAQRSATASQLYENAAVKGIDFSRDASTGKFLSKAAQAAREGEITKLSNTPEIQSAVTAASRNLANRQVTGSSVMQRLAGEASEDPMHTVLGLDAVRKEIGYAIEKAGRAGDKSQAKLLTEIRKRFDTTFDAISPEYTVARNAFRDMSVPVNQMQTASEIAKRATSPTGKVTLSGLNNALRDDSIAAKATGFGAARLDDVFNNQQVNLLNALRADLERKNFADSASRAGSDTIQKAEFGGLLSNLGTGVLSTATQSPILSRMFTSAINAASKGSRQKAEEQLAMMMLNPSRDALTMRPLPLDMRAPRGLVDLSPVAVRAGLLGYSSQ